MKLNILEKKAIIGVTLVSVLFVGAILIIGKRNLWFETKNHYTTLIKDADGLREGSVVTMSGLRVGEVVSLKVASNNLVEVGFTIKSSLGDKIKQDALVRLFRNFIIGEKRVDIFPGSEDAPPLGRDGHIPGQDSMEIADLISGQRLSEVMGKLNKITDGFEKWTSIMQTMTDKIKVEDVGRAYDLMYPTLENFSTLTKELLVFTNILKEIKKDVVDTKLLTSTMGNANRILAPVAKREDLLEQVLNNVRTISDELSKNPTFSKDIITALKEVTVTLKAIQKTWMLKGHVEDVRVEN